MNTLERIVELSNKILGKEETNKIIEETTKELIDKLINKESDK